MFSPIPWMAVLLAALIPVSAQITIPQIEQARRMDTRRVEVAKEMPTSMLPDGGTAQPDDAFGAQIIMKENEKVKPFTATAELAPFYTNNVALTRSNQRDDTFLAMISGVGYRRPLSQVLIFDADVRGTIYRYNRYRALNFQSLTAAAQFSYTPQKLRNTAFFARYGYTQLTAKDFGEKFFDQHAFTVGVQRAFPISDVHGFVVGLSAQWAYSDPRQAQRDEYTLFLAYRASLSRKLSLDAAYRGALFVYSESDPERNDFNHTLSLGLRYEFSEHWYASVGASAIVNRSDESAFTYDALNIGGTLGVSGAF